MAVLQQVVAVEGLQTLISKFNGPGQIPAPVDDLVVDPADPGLRAAEGFQIEGISIVVVMPVALSMVGESNSSSMAEAIPSLQISEV